MAMQHISLCMLLSASLSAGVIGAQLPEAAPAKIIQPPALDGKLDEAFWQTAQPLGEFNVFGRAGEKTSDTQVKIAYDDTWLYFGIACRSPQLKILQPKVIGHDKGAAGDDSVEIFLDPSGTGKLYFHYILSYAGAKDERRITVGPNGEISREADWNMPWPAAIAREAEGWSAELAIPLYLITSYGDFKAIRFNVARNKRVPSIDANAVIVSESRESSTWAPVEASFHEPKSFGVMHELGGITPKIPALASLSGVTILPYRRGEDGRLFYDVEAAVKAETPVNGEFELTVNDTPLSGKSAVARASAKTGERHDQKITIPVPVESMGQRQVEVALRTADGTPIGQVVADDLSALKIMDAYLDRNYYTAESNATVVCALQLPEKFMTGMTLKALANGKVLAELAQLSGRECLLRVPITTLVTGANVLSVALCQTNGEAFYTIPLPLLKRAPQPGNEWKIDRINRIILNNEKPFFPCGLVMYGVAPDSENDFKALADAGFNTFMQWTSQVTPVDLATYQRTAAKYGLYVMQNPDETCIPAGKVEMKTIGKLADAEKIRTSIATKTSIGLKCDMVQNALLRALPVDQRTDIFDDYYQANLTNMMKAVELTRGFTNNIGYFIFDEPLSDEIFKQSKFGRDYYRRINEHDGYHPVYVNYSSHIPAGEQYVDWFDVQMTDPYWTPGAGIEDGIRGTINFVPYITCLTDKRASERRQPIVIIPVAENWSGMYKRALTAPEQICQSYLALIHGAKGLFFFCYPFKYAKTMQTFKELGDQLKALGPAVTAPDVAQEIKYANEKNEPLKEVFPSVQARLFAHPAGGHILLAANSKPYPVSATFTIAGEKEKIGELFSKRTHAVEKESFKDCFEAYGVRAYKLDKPEAMPVKIAIDAQEDKTGYEPESAWTYRGRIGKKNLMPNPGFEERYPDKPIPYYYIPWIWGKRTRNVFIDEGDWVTDPSTAYEGKYSLRMRNDGENGILGFTFNLSPKIAAGADYTFSVYLKADHPGIRGVLHHGGNNDKMESIELTTEWKRYSITRELGAGSALYGRYYAYKLRIAGTNWTVWADAVQVEQGSQPTEFQP